jgi:hypothetical protein
MRKPSFLFLIPLAALFLLAEAGCKPSPQKVKKAEPPKESTSLLTMVHVANPDAAKQLVTGFYEVEQNAWRWTAGRFSVTLRPPAGAAERGAVLVFRFTVPEAVIQKLKEVRLTAKVGPAVLPGASYSKPGEYVYSQTVPPGALAGDAATVEFELDKFLAAGSVDSRELGVVATMIGFEVR